MIRLGIVGITGRMGASLLACLKNAPVFSLEKVFVRQKDETGRILPVHTVQETDLMSFLGDVDVVIDFSSPSVSQALLKAAGEQPTPLVICTTGHDAGFASLAKTTSARVPLLLAPNTSLGVAVFEMLLEKAAPALKAYDVTLHEAHHIHKKDAPSGTAKALLEVLKNTLPPGKDVCVSSTRAGGILGDHEVSFVGEEEILTLSHRCINRDLFAKGALHAGAFMAGKPPGLYTMRDVLEAPL